MTIIEHIKEYLDPAIVKVGKMKNNPDGTASVTVQYWNKKHNKEKIFRDGKTYLDETASTKAQEYRDKMLNKMHGQKRAYAKD